MHGKFGTIGKMFIALGLAALLGGIATGCGQKGDLYLPEKQEDQSERV